jgi:hypothetical protein
MTRWLHLAAAPTFAVVALSTIVLDSGAPNALCAAAGGADLNGMAPMYLLMAFFHLTPWLKMISRRGGMTLFRALNRSGDVQTMEQMP